MPVCRTPCMLMVRPGSSPAVIVGVGTALLLLPTLNTDSLSVYWLLDVATEVRWGHGFRCKNVSNVRLKCI